MDANSWTIVSAGITIAVAAAAAVFAWVQAKAAVGSREDAQDAQTKAEIAQAAAEAARTEANRIADEARAALDRSAAALERANELTEATIPTPSVKWTVSPLRKDSWIVKNTGDLVATNVQLSGTQGIMTDEDSAADEVPPGHTLEFAAWRGGGMETPRLTIEWNDPVSQKRESESIAIR